MRIFIVILLILVTGGAVWYVTRATEAMSPDACRQVNIVAFGDSLVTGYGTTEGNDFVSRLSKETGTEITNLGRNGETTASARARVGDVVRERPDVVIILLGGNDALQKVPVEETQANLDAIIESLESVSSVQINVVLVGVLGSPFNDPYRSMFEELAKKHSVEYVPNILSGIFGNRALMTDQIHPNDEGHAKMAERLLPALLRACEEAGKSPA